MKSVTGVLNGKGRGKVAISRKLYVKLWIVEEVIRIDQGMML